ncbi:unnamed protein product [Microthlaspi erraticum]|uniref:RNase H type-1 domain-containing protein n=1 Tax=Microthlaspi erraticum TaxID=1685480 RepID=A0A6D2IFU0_9BRAS|nr:unnamed protein product [Microthlaspi erraticum]
MQTPSVVSRFTSNPIHPKSVRCNTDGAWNEDRKAGGMGWVFHNCNQILITQRSKARKHIASSLIADQGLAIRFALEHAVELGFTSLHVVSDSQQLVKAINSESWLSEIYGILQDISHLSSLFKDVNFVSISREANLLADSLAKQYLHAFVQLEN